MYILCTNVIYGVLYYQNPMPLFNLYKEEIQQVRKPTNLWFKEASSINHSVSTIFGPHGMHKFTVDGEILSTGKDVLDNIELGPLAEPILKSINAQYKEFQDGTTSLALLLSRMMIQAHNLSTDGVEMQTIISGYEKAIDLAIEVTKKKIKRIKTDDVDILQEVIHHSLAGTIADKEAIISSIRDAILFLKEPKEEDISVLAEEDGEGNEVILGVKLDYNRIREDMPDKLNDVTVALIDKLTPRKTNIDIKIGISLANGYSNIAKMEDKQLREAVDKLIQLGVKAVFAKGEIDPRAADMMAREGIIAFQKLKDDDMKTLAKTTGARVANISLLSKDDLGYVGTLDDSKEEGCVGGVCRT